MLPFLKKHRPTLEEIEEIRTNRTEGIRRVIAVFGIIFLVLVSFLVSMLVLTPLLELYALKHMTGLQALNNYLMADASWLNVPADILSGGVSPQLLIYGYGRTPGRNLRGLLQADCCCGRIKSYGYYKRTSYG